MIPTPGSIAAEAIMLRSAHSGAILIAEGSKDCRVLRPRLRTTVELINSRGKDNVLGAIQILNQRSLTGVLAIIDRDFYEIDGPAPSLDNLVISDLHDIECELFKRPSFEKVLNEFATAKAPDPVTARSLLTEAAMPVGALRLINDRRRLDLDFNDLRFDQFINRVSLKCDIDTMTATIVAKTRRGHDKMSLTRQVRDVLDQEYDPMHLCCGHDLIAILALSLRRAFASMKNVDTTPESLERSLRLAYEASHFKASRLYESIRQWESANPSFPILA